MSDEELLAGLQRLVRRLNEMPDAREAKATALGEHVADYLGQDPQTLPVTSETFGPHRLGDVDVALTSLSAADPQATLIGITGGQQRQHEDLPGLLQTQDTNFGPGPVEYTSVSTGPDSSRQVIAFGMHLFRFAGMPAAVLVRAPLPGVGRDGVMVEVIVARPELGSELLTQLRQRMNELSLIRGQVVSLTSNEFENGVGRLTFLPRPDVASADVILPDGMLDQISAHVVDIGTHADQLRSLGQHLKRGVLLYGPPGTGKTLTVQHLLAATPGRTAIVLQGGSLGFAAEAAQLARAMAPSLLVLEDIDLIALERGMFSGPQPLLFDILDALDGIGGDVDVAFLMTTNRADVLEPALAARPGRVDLAVEIPLPDAPARRRLFRLYGADSPLSAEALDTAADKAEGVTASFAKELIRRALLRGVLAGRDTADNDLHDALDEMLDSRAELTRTLFGSNPTLGDDDEPDAEWS